MIYNVLMISISTLLTFASFGQWVLTPMAPQEQEEFKRAAQAEYAAQLEKAGINVTMQDIAQEIAQIAEQESHFLAIRDRDADRCVAQLWWSLEQNEASIEYFCVAPEYRGKGHGTSILKYLEQYYFKDSIKQIKLHVFRHNLPAVRLYTHAGYTCYSSTEYGYFMHKTRNKQMLSFSFKIADEQDLPLLYRWFKEPHVAQWWPVPGEKEHFFNSFLTRIRKGTMPYIVSFKSKPLGYMQTYPLDKADTWLPVLPEHTLGIDQFIGEPDYIGKGYGTQMLKAFIMFLVAQNSVVSTFIVDPDPANKAAIRSYQKAGFSPVGEWKAPWGMALVMRYNVPNR